MVPLIAVASIIHLVSGYFVSKVFGIVSLAACFDGPIFKILVSNINNLSKQ